MTKITNNALRITTESADRSWAGVAAAYGNLNGTGTIALGGDDLNLSGVIDNASGDYTYSFSNSMSGTNYIYSTGAPANFASDCRANMNLQVSDAAGTATLKTASGIRIITGGTTVSGGADRANISVVIHGSLA